LGLLENKTKSKRLIDRLYYTFYTSVRRGIAHAERASFLLSMCCSLFVISIIANISIFFGFELNKNKSENSLIYALAVLVVVIVFFIYFNSYYFVRNGRYRKILNKYGVVSKKNRLVNLFIVIVLFFGSLSILILTGLIMSDAVKIF